MGVVVSCGMLQWHHHTIVIYYHITIVYCIVYRHSAIVYHCIVIVYCHIAIIAYPSSHAVTSRIDELGEC